MGKGRVDDAGLHRDAIDSRKREAYDEVEGADAPGHGNRESQSADERQEKRIDQVQAVEEGSSPHGRGCHEPVHNPDEGSIGEEHPFLLHPQAAREALAETTEYAPYLAAEAIGITIAPQGPDAGESGQTKDGDYPPYAEIQTGRHRGPDLLDKEVSETVEPADNYNYQQKEHHKKFPATLQHNRAEHLVV